MDKFSPVESCPRSTLPTLNEQSLGFGERISHSKGCRLLTLALLATMLALVRLNSHPEIFIPAPAVCRSHSINEVHEMGI